MINRILVLLILLPVLAVAQQTLFSETFANGVLENPWYPGFLLDGVGNAVEPAAFAGNPSGDGWVGKLSTDRTDSGGVAESFSGDGTLSDFYMEANLFIPIGGNLMVAEYLGIEFRVDSSGLTSAYQLVTSFRSTTKRIRFRKREGAAPTVFRDWSAAEIPGGVPADSGWHKLAVRAVGNQFWLYYDDQELAGCPYSDTTSTLFTQGFVGIYAFHLNMIGYSTTELLMDDILVTETATSIKEDKNISTSFQLHQNYPNPFNPTTQISFELPSSEFVQLEVYNLIGQKVRTLLHEVRPPGVHQVTWDARDDAGNELPAGIYYYQLKSANFQQTRKMLLVK
jgi:hypothetical protein